MKFPRKRLRNFFKYWNCYFFVLNYIFSPLLRALVNIDQGNYQRNNEVHQHKIKKLPNFSYSKNIAIFEEFCQAISSSTNLLYPMSEQLSNIHVSTYIQKVFLRPYLQTNPFKAGKLISLDGKNLLQLSHEIKLGEEIDMS